MSNDKAQIRQGLEAMSLTFSEEQIDKWILYLQLMHKWNKVTNLTSIRDIKSMISVHLFDSLSIAPLPAGSLLDIGSGGGLPGIPLSILEPEREITLLDSNIKKVRFMHQAVTELGLTHVEVVHSRVEAWEPEERYRFVISRAFTALPRFVELCSRFVAQKGEMLAMIGKLETAELSAIPPQFVYTVANLTVPELDAERHLVAISTS